MAEEFYIGSYAPPGEKGVTRICLDDDGTPSIVGAADIAPGPSYLMEARDGAVFAVLETDSFGDRATGGVARYAPQGDALHLTCARSSEGTYPCHLSCDDDGRWLFVANYGDGSVAVFAIEPDGALTLHARLQHEGKGADPERQEGPHAHCAMLTRDQSMLLVCDLGLDALFAYPFQPRTGALLEPLRLSFPPGSGPRHIALSHDGRFAYVVHELSCEVSTIALEGMRVLQTVPVLEAPCPGNTCAAIKLCGDRLYVSNRGHDSVAAFYVGSDGWLTRLAVSAVGARTPRDIEVAGETLLAACMDDDVVVALRIKRDGKLERVGAVGVKCPTCVVRAM